MTERRRQERIKTPVKRTILATVEDEAYGSLQNHLYIVDISENGLRINLDRLVEPESEIYLKFSLNAFGHGLAGELEARCRVVWAKPLAGGTCILGMEFLDLEENQKAYVDSLLEHWSKKEGLELIQLPEPVNTKIRYEEGGPWAPMVGLRAISHQGFQYSSKIQVEPEQRLEVRILLEPGTVTTAAEVRWCKLMSNGAYDIGCHFVQLSNGHKSYIDLHLRRCRHRPL